MAENPLFFNAEYPPKCWAAPPLFKSSHVVWARGALAAAALMPSKPLEVYQGTGFTPLLLSLLVPNRGLHRYAETAANFPLAAKTGGPTLGPQAGPVGWSTPSLASSWRTRRGQPTVRSSPSHWRVTSSLYKRTTAFDHTSNSSPPHTPTTTDLISDASARHGRNTRRSGRACVTRAPAASTLSARAHPHRPWTAVHARPPQLRSFRLPDKGTAPGRGGGFILPGSTLSMTTRAGLGNYVWRSCAAALA